MQLFQISEDVVAIQPVVPVGGQLIQQNNLSYQGCFRVPAGSGAYYYPTKGLAYNPVHDSLYVMGYDASHTVAEISIPSPIKGAQTVANLNRATELQPLTDPTDGTWANLQNGSAVDLGGVLVYANRLIATAYRFYDADGSQPSSHWSRSVTLSDISLTTGPVELQVTTSAGSGPNAGFVSGYMGQVPMAWQSAFGGPAITGNCGIPIITRTSYGPAAFAFNPEQIGSITPVPTTPLVFYPSAHPTLGPYTPGPTDPNPNLIFNPTMQMGGVVMPTNFASVLFFGMLGVGPYAYGVGTGDPSLAGQPVPGDPGVVYVYDPVNSSKGEHGYPYQGYVWAYDATQLAEVAMGNLNPWDVIPYAVWHLIPDFNSQLPFFTGAAYDAVGQRIFLSQQFGDSTEPLSHVYSLVQTVAGVTGLSMNCAANRLTITGGGFAPMPTVSIKYLGTTDLDFTFVSISSTQIIVQVAASFPLVSGWYCASVVNS